MREGTGEATESLETLQPNEVLLSVSFHTFDKNTKTQEFLVLGSQSLTCLRDRFYCLEDHILCGTEMPSGYFLIENTFFVDTRNEKAIDYSKEIVSNLAEPKFHTCAMQDTVFLDLELVLGRPYIYCHQGNHEHIITFNEVRFANSSDEVRLSKYPMHVFQAKLRSQKCRVCDIHAAKFVCYDDKLTTESPFLFCETCYHSLHYDEFGDLLYDDFKVFPYYHE
eukprot:c19535_g1_i5.p1 GENE.c19535_g1_i5~~c19535_g1_i5.p1  ORF type:complete len:223 (+),score=53.70 c19535_g1_i5:384-1052(+)